ncbi:DUF2155 domain-containing protein [Zavarzinia compransoris]|uniref:DUF2155 domain-containing protein n=1 Tax=Zavarzinia marina TaxID=2911065 RepID=UPI001F3627B1|nr:DUF2155 domain-containing protein [Zavarzinia marina]MCF4164761.1 DUF2155 domain-containing protein [Zavarzinia marina]
MSPIGRHRLRVVAGAVLIGLGLALSGHALPGAARAQAPAEDSAPPEETVPGEDAAPPIEEIPEIDVPPAEPTEPAAPAEEAAPSGDMPGVVLGGLDKITGRTTEIRVAMGEAAKFGTLTIRVRQCITAPPDETPESSAFLEITDEPPGREGALPVFSGWMFASSPALSALEHPVYDVWVTACMTASPGKP